MESGGDEEGHRISSELPLKHTTAEADRREKRGFVLIYKSVAVDTEPRLAMGYSCISNQGREP